MNTVEDAYQMIAGALVSRVSNDWNSVTLNTKVLEKGCSSMETTESISQSGDCSISLGIDAAFKIDDAALFLRDDLLKTTGLRIWGLTFTLYPNGKFHIEYDYNKPEGYEESAELISGDEINQSLSELGPRQS